VQQQSYFTRAKVFHLFLLPVFIFSFLPLVAADLTLDFIENEQGILVGQQFRTYDIQASCSLNGFFCANTTRCNITVSYPNSSYVVNNKGMSVIGTYANYTLTSSQTSVLGNYKIN